MAPSWRKRFWDAIKPPPPVHRPGKDGAKRSRNQRILVWSATVVILATVASWLTYSWISSAPERAQRKYLEGMSLAKPATYVDAIVRFDSAIATKPDFALAYYQRGILKRYLNRDAEALADFDLAIQHDSRLSAAFTGRGYIYRERGDNARAIQEFTSSIEIEPTVDAYYERGQTYELRNEHMNAIADFDKAIAILREAPYVYRARAFVKQKIGDVAGYQSDREIAARFEGRR